MLDVNYGSIFLVRVATDLDEDPFAHISANFIATS
jgi:hypothetical protein